MGYKKAIVVKEEVADGQKYMTLDVDGKKVLVRPRSFAGNGKVVVKEKGVAVLFPSMEIIPIERAQYVGPGRYVTCAAEIPEDWNVNKVISKAAKQGKPKPKVRKRTSKKSVA